MLVYITIHSLSFWLLCWLLKLVSLLFLLSSKQTQNVVLCGAVIALNLYNKQSKSQNAVTDNVLSTQTVNINGGFLSLRVCLTLDSVHLTTHLTDQPDVLWSQSLLPQSVLQHTHIRHWPTSNTSPLSPTLNTLKILFSFFFPQRMLSLTKYNLLLPKYVVNNIKVKYLSKQNCIVTIMPRLR